MTRYIIHDPVTGREAFEGTPEMEKEFAAVMNGYDHSQTAEQPVETSAPAQELSSLKPVKG